MRVLVTGATGFVGPHLVDHLRAEGDEVIVSEAEITNLETLESDFARGSLDVVYHLAAQADVQASFVDPATTLRVNVEGTCNVLEAARRAGAGRVLMVSSADVYGRVDPADLPVTETAAMAPVSPYGASKAAAELVCVQAGLGRGLDVIRVRAFNHLGPGQSDRFVAAALASRVADNERNGSEAVRVGNLQARRDFTDVRDVVRAYRLLAEHGDAGEAFNVCSGASVSVAELAERLVARAAHPMRLLSDGGLMRPADLLEMRGDPAKLRRATGWRPQITLEETLDNLLDHWRQRTPRARAASTGADGAAGAAAAEAAAVTRQPDPGDNH
ncbi:MAG: GDP-mannose 4,6-dehydratase [Acidimicrobiaceae bacterium]|nr:GDP-mannose 4,6-dehydratase [Acidimicrobiaceae bacterium]